MITDYSSRTFGCELHDAPGACNEECLHIAFCMMGDPGPSFPTYDPGRVHEPKPMPQYGPKLEDGSIIWSYTHPDDCQCPDPNCPALLDNA